MMRKMFFCCACLIIVDLTVQSRIVKADEYPEVATTVAYNPGYLNAWGEVFGSILPAGDADPVCDEIHAICRRICADLPPGRTVGSISEVGITPPNYARGVGNPEVYHNQVWRVCRRVKNWGTGTRKTFAMQIVYAPNQESKKDCLLSLGGAVTTAGKTKEGSVDLACSSFGQTMYGEGLLNISSLLESPNAKLTVARADAVSKSRIVDPGNTEEINANDQLPVSARLTGTRYQVTVPGSGWVECDSGSGQCPIPTATWVKHSDGVGTLENAGKGPLSGRVVLDFIEVHALDLIEMYQVK